MQLRTFHQLTEGGATGLEIFHNWTSSPKQPIAGHDLSLVFNGCEYVDTEVDYLAFGNVVTPCLTCENLVKKVSEFSNSERNTVQILLEIPSKTDFLSWLGTPEAIEVLEKMGFVRK